MIGIPVDGQSWPIMVWKDFICPSAAGPLWYLWEIHPRLCPERFEIWEPEVGFLLTEPYSGFC